MNIFTKIMLVVGLIAAPSTLWTALSRYWDWAAKMKGSKTIQVIALVSVVIFIGLDLVDRLGILWSSPSQVQASADTAWKRVNEQAKEIDDLTRKLAAARDRSKPGTAVVFRGKISGKSNIHFGPIISNGAALDVQKHVSDSSISADKIISGTKIKSGDLSKILKSLNGSTK